MRSKPNIYWKNKGQNSHYLCSDTATKISKTPKTICRHNLEKKKGRAMLPEDLTYFLPPPHGRGIYAIFSTTPTLEGKAKG